MFVIEKRLFLLLSLALGMSSACDKLASDEGEEKKDQDKPVRVSQVGRADIEHILVYVADLRPSVEVKVYSPVPDRILRFPWNNGDKIRRGRLLALVRREGLDKGLEQIIAQIESLNAQLDNLESELARSKKLLAKGVITQQTFDKLQTSYLSTKAQLRALKASKGQLEVQAGNALISAPISGLIADKLLEVGDTAAPQIPLCRIMSIDRLKADLKLVESDVPKVRVNQEVLLHVDAYPNRVFRGSVTSIMPYMNEQTRTNTVEITLENPKDKNSDQWMLKPGMFARAELVVARRTQVLVAPEKALLLDNQILKKQKPGQVLRKAFVIKDNNLAKERLVHLGVRKGSLYEVKDGLAEGELIVIRGQHGLKEGQKVEVMASK